MTSSQIKGIQMESTGGYITPDGLLFIYHLLKEETTNETIFAKNVREEKMYFLLSKYVNLCHLRHVAKTRRVRR